MERINQIFGGQKSSRLIGPQIVFCSRELIRAAKNIHEGIFILKFVI